MPVQFINDAEGRPLFVVIPYAEYARSSLSTTECEIAASPSLLSPDGLFIQLPHGGPGAQIDLRQFVDAWTRRGTISVLAVSKRRQTYASFEGEARNGLDAIVRRCFLPDDSPYKNTMQATTAVVDAFVETGIFSLSIESMPGYYRPVQCIRINEENAVAFLQQHGRPTHPLDVHDFVLPY
ncbi:hypothetical protein SAMN05192549_108235 [Duganella sacchari]|uniref:Uncharacterized protein n=1 Tax=Duganella sacchari TaxID=551987 RepID=A0A1M7QY45_9BURK|nr:hypothetical protein [Duganella sacchari]SHN36884.1 hypothetical protein SAMN05192549_108235 [Duganella sacchari]